MVAVEADLHARLAPLADVLAQLDGERRRQRDRPLAVGVVVRGLDPVDLDAVDDLGAVEAC